MSILALDADTILTPFATKIGQHGFKAAMRYLKNLTKNEVAALHGAGVAVGLIFEVGAQNALGGEITGTRDGQLALAQTKALGAPATAAVYATADTDIAADQLPDAENYWAAFDAVIFGSYQIGGYADGTALSGLREHGLPFTWLAGAMGWNGSRAFLATGNPTIVQGPTIGYGGGQWNPSSTAQPMQWPALGFEYDPDLIMVDLDKAGLWLPPSLVA